MHAWSSQEASAHAWSSQEASAHAWSSQEASVHAWRQKCRTNSPFSLVERNPEPRTAASAERPEPTARELSAISGLVTVTRTRGGDDERRDALFLRHDGSSGGGPGSRCGG